VKPGEFNQPFGAFYFGSSALVLAITAGAKLFASFLQTPILHERDALLGWETRQVLWFTASYESLVVAILLHSASLRTRAGLLAVTGGQFLLYRVFKAVLGDRSPCPCLGSVPRSLGVPDAFADWILILIACYFLCGAVLMLLSSADSPSRGSQAG
jgi:hypothetical protein